MTNKSKNIVRCGGKMKVIAQELFKCEKCGKVLGTCGWVWKCNEEIEKSDKLNTHDKEN